MTKSNIEKRLSRLEEQQDDDALRVVLVHPGEPEPVPRRGEHLVVLRPRDMGEVE
ncbi:MAG: hypothetical protein PHX88_10385 [Methanoculleus horonobensis]|nr:hypothetical protein [Methanoculleus horonobensis]